MADMSDVTTVWVFNGARSNFPSAIFSTRVDAEAWIDRFKLTGTLTRYPVDTSAYEWAVERGYFSVTKDEHRSPLFIGKFSSGSQEHYHYEDGKGGHQKT